jgi:beta-lactamase class A
MLTRRTLMAAVAGAFVPPLLSRKLQARALADDFARIEYNVAGRLGVAVLDSDSGRSLAWRADELFPMCSTFKWLLAAQVLTRIDAGEEQGDRVIPYSERDILDHSSVTRAHLDQGGMPVIDLAAAAVSQSDNTAANLLLDAVGGPASLTGYLRNLGDQVTRLDRMEPQLNAATPGDPRDTTTPFAMVEHMRHLLLGDGLSEGSRSKLIDWLVGSVTGREKLRAGLSAAWPVGDKTGMGGYGSTNDVAIVWPSGRKPVLIAAYLTETTAGVPSRNNALADVGRQVTFWVTEP